MEGVLPAPGRRRCHVAHPVRPGGAGRCLGRLSRALAPLLLAAAAPPALGDIADGGAGASWGDTYVIRPSINGFRLVSGDPVSLRMINGGVRCPGGNGLEPGGYLLVGQLSLTDCSAIAAEQPHVKGFRWGRSDGLDSETYFRMAYSSDPEPVSFQRLFPHGPEFSCFVYMVHPSAEITEDGAYSAPAFRWTPTVERHNFSITANGRRLFHRQRVRMEKTAKPTLHAGTQVCTQRWSISRFLNPFDNDQFWVCYTRESELDVCEKDLNEWHRQGIIFLLGGIVICLVLAYIVSGQTVFMACVNWVARLILYVVVAFVVVRYLVDHRMDADGTTFFVSSLSMIVVGGNLLLLPHWLLSQCEGGRFLAAFFVFCFAYSPAVFLDRLSYTFSLRLVMHHRPVALGLFGFAVEVLKHTLLSKPRQSVEASDKMAMVPPMVGMPGGGYMQMYQTSSPR